MDKQHWLAQFTYGRPRGRKNIKRGAKGRGSLSLGSSLPVSLSPSLSSSRFLGWHALTPQGCSFLYFLNKTGLSESRDAPRVLMSVTSNLCCDETESRRLCSPDTPFGNPGHPACYPLNVYMPNNRASK